MERRIIHKESYSAGKVEKSNNDDIYVGNNFVAVIFDIKDMEKEKDKEYS